MTTILGKAFREAVASRTPEDCHRDALRLVAAAFECPLSEAEEQLWLSRIEQLYRDGKLSYPFEEPHAEGAADYVADFDKFRYEMQCFPSGT